MMQKNILVIFLMMSFIQLNKAQEFSLNQGGTTQKDYYSVIPFEIENDKIVVKANIENIDYRFIFDTGSSNLIFKPLYEEIKLNSLTKISCYDGNGKIDSLAVVSLDSITFGGITFKNIPTAVAENNIFSECLGIDGFIGNNMLRNSIVRISLKDKTIIITDNKRKLNLNKSHSTKFYFDDPVPFITVMLKDKTNARDPVLFDSGANDFYSLSLSHFIYFQERDVFNDSLKGFGSNSYSLFGVGKDSFQYRLTVPEIKLEGTKFQNVTFNTTSSPDSHIGLKLLDYGIIIIDYKNKKFYFEPFKKIVNMQAKQLPFDLTFQDNKLSIGIIWKDKYKNQMSAGDQIIEINDVNYENYNICDVLKNGSIIKNMVKLKLKLKDKTGLIKIVELERE
ncbi:MAG: clan AA aspartic protease [Saprospiraceae bacterium]|nr:clan AA aspartic protease [Saprospiraceae bacterium]